MNLLGHITSQDIKESFETKYNKDIFGGIAVRAVLLNESSQIGLMHIQKFDAYKLPGGGVDDEENLLKAFEREIVEETGYKSAIINELGFVVEERDSRNDLSGMIQISFCYLAKANEFIGVELTEEEAEKGFELIWVESIEKAIDLIKGSYKDVEDAKFMSLRDESILRKAKEIL